MIPRRKFITLLGGVAATWPLPVRAQQPAMPVIALVSPGTINSEAARIAAFRKGLNETGYSEGQNVLAEYHLLDGHYERLPALLAELIQRRIAVITAPASTPIAIAAKAASTTIPIVFGVGQNPVELGLVASLGRPGSNATGINFLVREVNSKRFGLMHELLPEARRFAVLANPNNASSAEEASKDLQKAAHVLGLDIAVFNAKSPDEIDTAFAAIIREQFDALFIAGDGYFSSRAVQLATLAARNRMPASFGASEMVEAGLLMSYGVNFKETFRQAGNYVGRILHGAKPTDVPVEQSARLELVLNMRTAKALGLSVPNAMQLLADKVIE